MTVEMGESEGTARATGPSRADGNEGSGEVRGRRDRERSRRTPGFLA